MSKKSYILLSLALLLYATYFAWISFQFPYIIDDYYYRYIHIHQLDERIDEVEDIFTSQLWHYEYINGRSIIHSLLQLLFLLTTCKPLINIINAIVWIVLALAIVKNTVPKAHYKPIYWLLAVMALRFALPAGYNLPMWIAGNFNYYWTSLYALIILGLYGKASPDCPKRLYPIYAFLALLVGWSHESLAVGISIALITDVCLRKERNTLHILMCTACCIGCAIMVSAPGNYRRFDIADVTPTVTLIRTVSVLLQSRLFYVVILLLPVGLARRKEATLQFIRQQRINLVAMMGNLAFCAFVGAGERALFFSEFFALLVIMSYITTFYHEYLSRGLSIVLLVLFVAYEAIFARDWNNLYKEVNRAISEFASNPSLDHVVSKEVNPSLLTTSFIETSDERWEFYEYRSLSHLHNGDFRILPLSVYEAVQSGNLITTDNRLEGGLPFYTNDKIDWLVMPCDTIPPGGEYTYLLYPPSLQDPDLTLLGKLRRTIAPGSLPVTYDETENYSSHPDKPYLIDNKYYIVLKKPPHQRVKSVIFTETE